LSDIKVYIVEDQALIRESLRAMLDLEQDIEVSGEAASAEQALQELKTLDVDLVLMDIGLPGMDGIAAALKERRPYLPVVMLTSYQDEHVPFPASTTNTTAAQPHAASWNVSMKVLDFVLLGPLAFL
jgi:DNA-binding NarL/FixJ family response regulator